MGLAASPHERRFLERLAACEGILTEREALFLFRAARQLAESRTSVRCVEIGSFRGRSTVAIALGLAAAGVTQACLVAIDPLPPENLRVFRVNLRRAGVEHLVVHVPRYSWQCADLAPLPSDLLFIDGDHSYAAITKDLLLFAPHVRAGGILALHDVTVSTANLLDPNFATGIPSVTRAFRERVLWAAGWCRHGRAGSIGYAVREGRSGAGRDRLLRLVRYELRLAPRSAASRLLYSIRHAPSLAQPVEVFHRFRAWLHPRPTDPLTHEPVEPRDLHGST
jgi:predicted O-methyltransferase YrrM